MYEYNLDNYSNKKPMICIFLLSYILNLNEACGLFEHQNIKLLIVTEIT